MQINIRADSVEIEGYVNAVERDSKPLFSRMGNFIERICKGAFERAIKRNKDVHILLNHDWSKDLGSTKQGNLELREDNIGLKARAVITDSEVVEKAKKGELVGWSFGFEDAPDGVITRMVDGILHRAVKDLNLYEVSLLDKTKSPAYDGTLITARAEGEPMQFRAEPFIDEVTVTAEPILDTTEPAELREQTQPKQQEVVEKIDYTKYHKIIDEMKRED